jgi:hypothetical protein
MKKMRCLVAKGRLTLGCALILLLAISSHAQPSTQSPGFIYSVGAYGYVQKMDAALNVVATARVPGLARSIRIAGADISPDGKRLFLAVGREENPLVIVETADLSVVPDVNVVFPNTPETWRQHAPFDIIAISSEVLYWSDECYSAALAGAEYDTLLVNLNEKIARPIRDWGFENKNEIQISPDREKMAIDHGGNLLIIRASTGQILQTIDQKVIGQGTVMSFVVDWNQNALRCCMIADGSMAKLRIDMNSGQVVAREAVKNTGRFHPPGSETGRQCLTPATTYVLDEDGGIQIFDNTKCKLSKRLDSVVPGVTPGWKLALYVPPSGNLIFAQKDAVKTLADGHEKDISFLYAVDAKTGQVVRTVDYPDEIAAVLFGK